MPPLVSLPQTPCCRQFEGVQGLHSFTRLHECLHVVGLCAMGLGNGRYGVMMILWFLTCMVKGWADLHPGTDSTKSRAEQAAAAAERRRTYPAGRILHLVPSRFVFAEAAQSASGTAPSVDAAGTAAVNGRSREELVRAGQRWGSSERSWSEDDGSESSSDEDEDDLWEEMDTPDSPPAAIPGQPRVSKQGKRVPADASGSLNGLRDSLTHEGGSAQLLSQPGAAAVLISGVAANAADPTAAAVAIVGVRANHQLCPLSILMSDLFICRRHSYVVDVAMKVLAFSLINCV